MTPLSIVTRLILAASLALTACVTHGDAGSASADRPGPAGTKLTGVTMAAATPGAATPAQDKARLDAIGQRVRLKLAAAADGMDGMQVVSVRPMPMLGLYEVVTGDQKIVYTDEAVNYLISGHIYDVNSMTDLTGERLEQVTAIPIDSLPLDLAIKVVKGNGKRRVAVFSDTDCPFCRKFETEMHNVTDVTIYTFLFPIEQLHPNAPDHTRRIWCAPDRLQAWTDYWSRNALPDARQCDTSALDQILKLGLAHHINGTPTLIFADGHVIPGALPTAMLEKNLGPR